MSPWGSLVHLISDSPSTLSCPESMQNSHLLMDAVANLNSPGTPPCVSQLGGGSSWHFVIWCYLMGRTIWRIVYLWILGLNANSSSNTRHCVKQNCHPTFPSGIFLPKETLRSSILSWREWLCLKLPHFPLNSIVLFANMLTSW